MKAALFAAIVMAAPGAVVAQTTTCQQSVAGMPAAGVTCTTSPPPDPRTVPAKRCGALERFAKGSDQCGAQDAAARRKETAELISAGHCAEAKRAALEAGDLDLAEQVSRICTP